MPVVKCPACKKALKVSEEVEGKRVRCPACKNPFVVPESAIEVEEVQEVQTERPARRPRRDAEEERQGIQAERPARRPRRDADEEEDRPRPSRRARDEEEEEDDRPRRPRKRRSRDDDDERDVVSPSSAPLVFAILSCLFSCAPIIGFILGRMALNKADQELARLPGGKRFRGARQQMQTAKTIGVVGMCLSGVFLIIGIVWRIVEARH